MIVHIPGILDAASLTEVETLALTLDFEDGARTAGWHARAVKSNRQARPDPGLALVQSRIVAALEANEVFRALALPARILPPIISLTGPGEGYGSHVDDAIMGREHPLRTDLSLTLFLSAPQSYDGGELIAEGPSGEDSAKLPAGDAALYPSTTLHRVAPVTRGDRLVAVTWVQSRVRDSACREMLFDLDQARRAIFAREGASETFHLIAKTYTNLLRRWAEV